jgi:hypothetical protein
MSPEKDKAVFDRWPQFFRHKDDPFQSGMDMGFRCADGWFQLVWDLCSALEPLVTDFEASGQNFEVLQVKSKFGELRFYVTDGNEEIYPLIQTARQRSLETCEVCGKPGTCAPDSTGWWSTLCDECRKLEPNLRPYL